MNCTLKCIHTEEIEFSAFCDTVFHIIVSLNLGYVLGSVTSYSHFQTGGGCNVGSIAYMHVNINTCRMLVTLLQENSGNNHGALSLTPGTRCLGKG